MPVTLVNGSVLFSHPADWSTSPTWRRAWRTGVTAALTGAERRQSLRALPRTELSYAISALSLEERAMLDERLDAASKSGLACVPFWGRGSVMLIALGATLVMAETIWPWAVGDYVFLQKANAPQTAYLNFEAIRVTNVVPQIVGVQLTLSQVPAGNYGLGMLVWPLLFGKFSMEKESAETSWHGDVKITIAELTVRNQPAVGAVPGPAGPGIGGWAVGSTLIVS